MFQKVTYLVSGSIFALAISAIIGATAFQMVIIYINALILYLMLDTWANKD